MIFFPCLFQSYREAGCICPCQQTLHTSFAWAGSVSPTETFSHSAPGQSLCNISCTCLQTHGRNMTKEGNTIKKEAFCSFFTARWVWLRTGLMWQLQQRNGRPCCSPDLLSAQAQGESLAGGSVGSKSALEPGSLLSWPRSPLPWLAEKLERELVLSWCLDLWNAYSLGETGEGQRGAFGHQGLDFKRYIGTFWCQLEVLKSLRHILSKVCRWEFFV